MHRHNVRRLGRANDLPGIPTFASQPVAPGSVTPGTTVTVGSNVTLSGPGTLAYQWLFNDAPRALRIDSVEKLPDLFETMVKEADAATRQIRAKTSQAQQLAYVLTEVAAHTPMRKTDL